MNSIMTRWVAPAAALTIALLLVSSDISAQPGNAPSSDQGYSAPHFVLELDGLSPGAFRSITGGGATTEIIEEISRDGTVSKRPGLTTHPNIVLQRGFAANDDLWRWYQQVMDGQFQKRDGSVSIQRADGREIARWNFVNGWPSQWNVPASSDGRGNAVGLETIELAIEGWERAPTR